MRSPRSKRRYFCSPIPLIAPCLIVELGPPRRKHLPSRLEVGPRLVEGGRSAGRALARVRSRIEAAAPAPTRLIMRDAGADRNRADLHVSVIDVPAFLASIFRSAAGKGGHAPMIPPISPAVKPLRLVDWGGNRRYMPLGATAKFRAARFRSLVLGVGPQGLYGVSTNQRRRCVSGD